MQQVEDDWKALIDRLESHLAYIESQINSPEGDQSQSLAKTPLPLHPNIENALQVYVELVQFLRS